MSGLVKEPPAPDPTAPDARLADARRHRAGGATSRFGNPYRIGMTVPDDWTVGPGVHVASREFRVGRDVTVLNDPRPVAGVQPTSADWESWRPSGRCLWTPFC